MIKGFSLDDIILIKDGLNKGKMGLVEKICGYSNELIIVTLFNEGFNVIDSETLHPVASINMNRVEILTKD